jgi:arabinose-5-phosphate isomerase
MPQTQTQKDWLRAARAAIKLEARAVETAASRLNGNLSRAVQLLLTHAGKVVITGIGKSGHVARQLVATLCSTGTPAVFLHPADALHGDLGIYAPGDPTVLISNSGVTAEMVRLIPILRDFGSPLVGIIGNPSSPLATEVDVLIDAAVEREADPHNLAPTASVVVAMAMGHALAIALMQARNFTTEEFGRYHPGGQLGRSLRRKVAELMHSGDQVAWASPSDSLKQVIIRMTERPLGAACVLGHGGRLAGLITDGDLRRALQKHDDIRSLRAADVMTPEPVTITAEAVLREALHRMEYRASQISVLPVIDAETGRCMGLLRLHDISRTALG